MCPAPVCRKSTGLPAPMLFHWFSEGRREGSETAPGQPAHHHHNQVYLSISYILCTSSCPKLRLRSSRSCYPFFVAARMEMCFMGERRRKTEIREERKRSQVQSSWDLPHPRQQDSALTSLHAEQVNQATPGVSLTSFPERRDLIQEGISTVSEWPLTLIVRGPAHLLPLLDFLSAGFCMSDRSECSLTYRTLYLKSIIFVPPEKINRKCPELR